MTKKDAICCGYKDCLEHTPWARIPEDSELWEAYWEGFDAANKDFMAGIKRGLDR